MEEGSNLSKTTFQNPKWWPFLQDGCQINLKMIFSSRNQRIWVGYCVDIFVKIYCIVRKGGGVKTVKNNNLKSKMVDIFQNGQEINKFN